MAAPVIQGTPAVRDNAANTVATADYPTSPVSGELLCAYIKLSNVARNVTNLAALGFTQERRDQIASGGAAYFAWKAATGTEVGSFDFALDGSTASQIAMFRISGADTTAAVDISAATTFAAGVTPFTVNGVTTTGADRLLLWLFEESSASSYTFSRGTEFFDSSPSTRSTAGAWENRPTAGATGTADVTATTPGPGIGYAIAIKPSAGSSPPATPAGFALVSVVKES